MTLINTRGVINLAFITGFLDSFYSSFFAAKIGAVVWIEEDLETHEAPVACV